MRTLIAAPFVLAITFLVACGGNSNNGNNGGTTPLLTSRGTGDLEYVGYLDVPSTATKMSGTYWVNSGLCTGDSNPLQLAKQ